MNWGFDDALATADQHSFFKFMVKSIAEKHGLRATFMPKPFAGLTGNGCHVHLSVWDKAGKNNVFADDKDELGLSAKGYHFLGGIMKHATALAAITNPTVNSYKRINAPRTVSGATWSPNTVTWTGNNRTHMVRVPGAGRFELRLPDGAANPYLLQAVDPRRRPRRHRTKADPGKRYDIDMYAEGHKVKGAPKLPLNLLDALRDFEKDKALKAALGEEFSAAYLKLKHQEWNSYARTSPNGSATTRSTSDPLRRQDAACRAARNDRHEVFDLLARPRRTLRPPELAARLARRQPKQRYDVVIIGGGGHGLATAYYLASEYGIRNVAVLEKGWIGSGNAGRNTTIIRSNYLLPGNIGFYELSMKLWERMEQDLNYNTMVSQRGIVNLYHSDAQRDAYARRGNAMRINGIDAELLDLAAVRKMMPFLNFDNARFPIQGGLLQRRGGTARHDAVVWGYAHAASGLGVDIIQNCEVTGFVARRQRQGRRRRDDARSDRRRQGRHGGGRQLVARRRDGRPAPADREPCAAGLRVGRRSSR